MIPRPSLFATRRMAAVGATSPLARVSAKDREPPTPVVHLCRAKGRFGIRRSYSWSELDQPFRVDLGFWVRFLACRRLFDGEAHKERADRSTGPDQRRYVLRSLRPVFRRSGCCCRPRRPRSTRAATRRKVVIERQISVSCHRMSASRRAKRRLRRRRALSPVQTKRRAGGAGRCGSATARDPRTAVGLHSTGLSRGPGGLTRGRRSPSRTCWTRG
jgi:hypothetical protein